MKLALGDDPSLTRDLEEKSTTCLGPNLNYAKKRVGVSICVVDGPGSGFL